CERQVIARRAPADSGTAWRSTVGHRRGGPERGWSWWSVTCSTFGRFTTPFSGPLPAHWILRSRQTLHTIEAPHSDRRDRRGQAMGKPIWELFIDETDTPVAWIDHKPNLRFALYNGGTTNPLDDLVLDKETGLIWPRNANVNGTAM